MKARLAVLHVVPTLQLGGAAISVVELLRHLSARSDIKPSFCVLGFPEEAFLASPIERDTTFLRYRFSLRDVAGTVRCVRSLRELIKKVRPNIVHSHLLPADMIAGLAVMMTGLKHVAHIRDTREWLCSKRPADRLKRQLYRSVYSANKTNFLAVSSEAAKFASDHLRIGPERFQVILNGIDTQALKTAPPDRVPKKGTPFVIGSAGRFVPAKDHISLIESMAWLSAKGYDVRLRLAGSGSLEGRYRRLAEALRLGDRLEIVTDIRDMAAFFDGIDVFALSSKSGEGLPRVVLEAMAGGCAVVSTRVAGISEAIEEGRTGLIVDRGDVTGLTSALERLLLDADLRSRLAAAGRAKVLEGFTSERVAREVVEAYDRVLVETPRS